MLMQFYLSIKMLSEQSAVIKIVGNDFKFILLNQLCLGFILDIQFDISFLNSF